MALARQSEPDQSVTKDMININGVAGLAVVDRPQGVDIAIQKLA
jgi:hypothetical protein